MKFAGSILLGVATALIFSSNLSAQFFTRVTDIGPIVTDPLFSTGASWNDFNNDGHLDLYALAERENHFYLNNGDNTFSEITSGHFLTPFGTGNLGLWADYNNDGYLDMYLCNFVTEPGGSTVAPNFLYKNSGPPDFNLDVVNIGSDLNACPSASWVDYDQDGDLDLFAAGAAIGQGGSTEDIFYRNNGNDDFQRLAQLSFLQFRQGFGTHDVWVDYDNDGDQDLFVLNWRFPNELYKSLLVETGNPNRFEAIANSGLTDEGAQFDIGSNWGDYDNDGDLDVFIAFTGNTPDRLYQNNGDGTFMSITNTPITANATSTTFGGWGDFDNDGDLDLFAARFAASPASPALYRNDGNGQFVATTQQDVGEILTNIPSPQGGNWGDYDSDGDLDLYVLTYAIPSQPTGTPQPNYLFRNNQGSDNHWLKVKCAGTLSNRSAMGAKISVKATIGGNPVRQTRFISGGATSFVFQGEQNAHFGLGDAAVVDSLVIEWPSGIKQTLENISVDQLLTVTEEIPSGFLRPNFYAGQTAGFDTTALTVQFTDVSLFDPNSPINAWEWDFDNDGTVDATEPNPAWNFVADEEGARFSVKLTVSNGMQPLSLLREDYIEISGVLPNLIVDTGQLDLGNIPANLASYDTTFYVHNTGSGADSLFTSISDFFTADSNALSIQPAAARIAGQDSLAITFTIYPNLMAPRFYFPQIRIEAQRNPARTVFERRIRFTIDNTTGIEIGAGNIPYVFELRQNYPNPFNPETIIEYGLPKSSFVMLRIYNMLGEEIRTLVNQSQAAGIYTVDFKSGNLSSGVYIYRLEAGDFAAVKKMLLIR